MKTLVLFGFAVAAQAQTPTIQAVVNAASYATSPMAPGMAADLFGTNLGGSLTLCTNSNKTLPLSCNGVSVLVNGNPAPVYYTSATEVNFQVPVDLTGSSAAVQVKSQTGGQTLQSTVVTVPVAPTAPGLFTVTASGSTSLGTFLDSAGSIIGASNPAHAGDIVAVFGTGFGVTNPVVASGSPAPATPPSNVVASVKVSVSGVDASVLSAVLTPGDVGINQITFKVPQFFAGGNLPVVANAGGVASLAVLLPVVGPKVTITGVSNNASGGPNIASGSWVSIYGSNLSATSRIWGTSDFSGNNLPSMLDGVSVKINGKSAAVYYISPGQINVQAPADIALGPVAVGVTNAAGSGSGTVTLATYAPGFFTVQTKYAAAVHTDGVYVAPAGFFGAGVVSRPAQPGETILIFGTGIGPTVPPVPAGQIFSGAAPLTDAAQLHIRIGGAAASVSFAGIVAAGEYQFNVVIPVLPDGEQPIVADAGGVSTQSGLSITVKN